jgi:hypothetical protein
VIDLFERALALDPASVEAQSLLATVLANRVLDYMSDSTAADIERSDGLIGQALEALPRSPLAHWAKGQLLTAKYRYDRFRPVPRAFSRAAVWQRKELATSRRACPRESGVDVLYREIGQLKEPRPNARWRRSGT